MPVPFSVHVPFSVQEVKQYVPVSPREKLQKELQAAIDREDYEKAAKIRDALSSMKKIDDLSIDS